MRRLLALLLVLSFSVAAEEGEAPAPQARVDQLHEVLLSAMRLEGGVSERKSLIAPVVLELFDVASIARISTGRAWRSFDDAQRAALIDALNRLLVTTYADRFDSYNGQAFEHVELSESRTGAIVKTEIVRSSGERVPIDYYFRGDKVFNVVASGVSDLSLRRAEYSSILKEQSYSALLEHIDANIRELESDESEGGS